MRHHLVVIRELKVDGDHMVEVMAFLPVEPPCSWAHAAQPGLLVRHAGDVARGAASAAREHPTRPQLEPPGLSSGEIGAL